MRSDVLHDILRQRLRTGQYGELGQNLSALQRRYEADFRVESELVRISPRAFSLRSPRSAIAARARRMGASPRQLCHCKVRAWHVLSSAGLEIARREICARDDAAQGDEYAQGNLAQ